MLGGEILRNDFIYLPKNFKTGFHLNESLFYIFQLFFTLCMEIVIVFLLETLPLLLFGYWQFKY